MVRCGDALSINCVFNGSCFRFTCTGIVRSSQPDGVSHPGGVSQNDGPCKEIPDKRRQVDDVCHMEDEETLDDLDPDVGCQSNAKDVQSVDRTLYLLDRLDLGRLNDIHFNKAYSTAVQTLLSQSPPSHCGILDLTQGFSPLAVQALKLGADYAHVVTENATHKALLQAIAVSNSVDPNRLSFSGCNFHEYNREWSVIVSELVEPCGCLRQQVLEDIALARYVVSTGCFCCTITYQAFSSRQPAYLHSLLTPARRPRQRRSSNSNLLFVPSVKTNVGTRAFSVAAPTLELTPC